MTIDKLISILERFAPDAEVKELNLAIDGSASVLKIVASEDAGDVRASFCYNEERAEEEDY